MHRIAKLVALLFFLSVLTALNPASSPAEEAESLAGKELQLAAETPSLKDVPGVSTYPPAGVAPRKEAPPPAETRETKVLPSSFDPFDYLVYRPLWAVSGWIGNFDPVGNAVAPLEEKAPGLKVKGFVNNITQINLTGDDRDVGLGHRVKDWRLQKQEIRTELELQYQATPSLFFGNTYNFQYDGAYDWQNSDGIFDSGAVNQKYYSQGKRILRELYVRGNYGRIGFTLGKQIVNWGKMDGKVIDIVNAADGRDVIQFNQGDYEWRAIGQWMAYLSLRAGDQTTVNLLWNPDFQPNVGPAPGSPYFPPFVGAAPSFVHFLGEEKPKSWNFKDSEAGVRVDTTLGALTLSGIYFYSWDRDAVYFKSVTSPPLSIDFTPRHTRLHRFGFSSELGAYFLGRNWVIRSEGLYTKGKSFSTADPADPDGVVKKDTLKVGLVFETQLFTGVNKIGVLYQPVWIHTFDFDKNIESIFNHRNDIIHVLNLSHSVRKTDDRLNLSATFYPWVGSVYNGLGLNVAASWRFSQWITAKLAYYNYSGKDDEAYGMYRKWDNLTLDAKYEF